MERKKFLTWLSEVDRLSEAQKQEAGEVLAGRPAGEASLAAIEMGVGEDRSCPPCGAHGSQWPTASRWDFDAILAAPAVEPVRTVTNTPASGQHRKELWLTFGECLANGDTVAVAGRVVRTAPALTVMDQGCTAGERRQYQLSTMCRRPWCQPRGTQPVVANSISKTSTTVTLASRISLEVAGGPPQDTLPAICVGSTSSSAEGYDSEVLPRQRHGCDERQYDSRIVRC